MRLSTEGVKLSPPGTFNQPPTSQASSSRPNLDYTVSGLRLYLGHSEKKKYRRKLGIGNAVRRKAGTDMSTFPRPLPTRILARLIKIQTTSVNRHDAIQRCFVPMCFVFISFDLWLMRTEMLLVYFGLGMVVFSV